MAITSLLYKCVPYLRTFRNNHTQAAFYIINITMVIGDFMVRKKMNFRGPIEVEKELFKVARQVQEGKMSSTAASVVVSACNSWLRAHESRKVTEFEHRLNMLEAQRTLDEAKKRTARG